MGHFLPPSPSDQFIPQLDERRRRKREGRGGGKKKPSPDQPMPI